MILAWKLTAPIIVKFLIKVYTLLEERSVQTRSFYAGRDAPVDWVGLINRLVGRKVCARSINTHRIG